MPVGLDLVDQHGALLAAVARQIALPVAVDVEAADYRRAVHRVLPRTGVDGLALPGHILRQADVHRQQHGRDRHACPREAISSGVSSRSMPCGITLCPGSSRSRPPSRWTSTLSGSKEIRPEIRRTSVQASSYDHAARRASPMSSRGTYQRGANPDSYSASGRLVSAMTRS